MVTDGLGLVTLLIAGTSAAAIADDDWAAAVGDSAPMLIVLGSLLLGGVLGSMLGIEQGLEGFGAWLQARLTSRSAGQPQSADRQRFIEGFVSSSLVFCVGPLTVLGSVNDGLGNGADQLYLKAALDGFAAIAFAASLGWGVAASALSVLVVQGTLTRSARSRRRPARRGARCAHRHRRPDAGRGGAPAAADPAGPGRRPAARSVWSRRS